MTIQAPTDQPKLNLAYGSGVVDNKPKKGIHIHAIKQRHFCLFFNGSGWTNKLSQNSLPITANIIILILWTKVPCLGHNVPFLGHNFPFFRL